MTAVGLVTIHHEGAGDPGDLGRIGHAGYTYGVNGHEFRRYRTVAESFATLGFNHVSVDVCLSGNRCSFAVTNDEIARIGGCVHDARQRGEVIGNPIVRPHCWSPGSNTACPCSRTLNVFGAITKACQGAVPNPTPPAPNHPTLAPGAHGQAVSQLQHELNVGCGYHLTTDGIFGHLTLLAVTAFQAFFRLAVDGIVGPKTWAMLDYCYAVKGGR